MKRATLTALMVILAAPALAACAKPPDGKSPPARLLTPDKQKALDQYKKILDCYMHSDFAGLKVEMARMGSTAKLPQSARSDITYIRKMIPEYRPTWWKNCRNASNVSFRAKIWEIGRAHV